MFGLVSKKRLDNLQKGYDKLKLRLDNCRQIEAQNKTLREQNKILRDRILSLENEIREIKIKLREQTEADLFFISAKIQKKLLDGEPKENVQDLGLQQIAYQQQLAQMQQQSPYPSSFLNSLGLGGLAAIANFGNRY